MACNQASFAFCKIAFSGLTEPDFGEPAQWQALIEVIMGQYQYLEQIQVDRLWKTLQMRIEHSICRSAALCRNQLARCIGVH
jgi:hypothetical protein